MIITVIFFVTIAIIGFFFALEERREKIHRQKREKIFKALADLVDPQASSVLKDTSPVQEIDFTDQLDIPISDIEENILRDVLTERQRQFDLWGDQDHPSVCKSDENRPITEIYGLPTAAEAREDVEVSRELGYLSWAGIATEELSEVVEARTEEERREELVQLTALLIGWIEAIDRKSEDVKQI